LTIARSRAVARGEVKYAAFALGRNEPPDVARITRNLANQFELPVIFYAVIVLLVVIGRVSLIDVLAAWVFVAGRVIHTLVQTLTDDVPLRGRVFMINFAALVVLVVHVLMLALEGVGRPLG
ncbi:MAG: MAPEG family protein, partial [Xanthobacteraceae bacterium]|nr:MAPEG family protein [Xanthobacteraceae bacterium]